MRQNKYDKYVVYPCFLNYDAIKKEHSINAEYMLFLQQVAWKCDLL